MIYPKCPSVDGGVTTPFSKSHKAVDIGWHDKQNTPILSVVDSTVLEVGGSTTSVHGLYVTLDHGDGVNWTRYQHLKAGSITVKVGDKLKLGQQFALKGNSGKTSSGGNYGTHLHFVWYKKVLDAVGKYTHAVDPQPLVYIYPDEQVTVSSMAKLPVPVPDGENKAVHQLQVTSEKLRVRKSAGLNGTVVGFAIRGFYNVGASIVADGYTWYKIGNYYMAITKNYSVDIPAESIDDLKKQIAELEAENTSLAAKISAAQKALM